MRSPTLIVRRARFSFAHNVVTRYCIALGERLPFYLTPVSLLNQILHLRVTVIFFFLFSFRRDSVRHLYKRNEGRKRSKGRTTLTSDAHRILLLIGSLVGCASCEISVLASNRVRVSVLTAKTTIFFSFHLSSFAFSPARCMARLKILVSNKCVFYVSSGIK